MEKCIGIDLEAKPGAYENIKIMSMDIQKEIKLDSNSVNVITMLAVLEHLKYPESVFKECYRILKPGGLILLTVPSPDNKPILEILAVFGFVRKKMIEQHENYFTVARLKAMAIKSGFKNVEVSLFELGLNTFLKAEK
jgi:ubiquinone/menaquinone biosynthesis C-methylase UbiE